VNVKVLHDRSINLLTDRADFLTLQARKRTGGLKMMHGKNLRIDPERLWDSLMEMAKIGPGIAGGNNRQTLTDEDAEGRALFQSWCKAAGMTMGVDTMGNMFATRAGEDPEA
jgi:N-carbamoyl-L-amino-acid hydrolase